MFCPECKAEYREGFARCSDCDVDLVYQLPKPAASGADAFGRAVILDVEGEMLRILWQGDSLRDCVELCQDLKEAGIYFRVNQKSTGLAPGMNVAMNYQIGVHSSEYDRAKELWGIEDKPAAEAKDDGEEGCGDPSAELPEAEDSLAAQAIGEERARARNYLKPWYPDDAIVKIWPNDPVEDNSETVQACLTENFIHFQMNVNADGKREIFVQREDEACAREIVREITEGIVPE
jgi:hypothetical protein